MLGSFDTLVWATTDACYGSKFFSTIDYMLHLCCNLFHSSSFDSSILLTHYRNSLSGSGFLFTRKVVWQLARNKRHFRRMPLNVLKHKLVNNTALQHGQITLEFAFVLYTKVSLLVTAVLEC